MSKEPTEQASVLTELRRISRILILGNATAIEAELSKIATSNERKRMWIALDGKRMPKDIAAGIGVTAMAVSVFLNLGIAASLIEYEKGKPPRVLLDYVPPRWLARAAPPSEVVVNAETLSENTVRGDTS